VHGYKGHVQICGNENTATTTVELSDGELHSSVGTDRNQTPTDTTRIDD